MAVLCLLAWAVDLSAAPPAAEEEEGHGTISPEEQFPENIATKPFNTFDFNVFPILFYTPETGAGAGAGTWLITRENFRGMRGKPTNLWVSGVYTQQDQTILHVIPEVYFGHDAYRLNLWLRYEQYPSKFFGIGNDSLVGAAELYTPRTRRASLTFSRRLVEDFSLGLLSEYDDTEMLKVEPGGPLALGTVPGSNGALLMGLGLLARWDSREQQFHPNGGALYELSLLRYDAALGSEFSFSRGSLDLRHYGSLAAGHILAGRFLYLSVQGDAPFYKLPRLGGKQLLRGYFEGRYRDKLLLALQTEYRVVFGHRFGGVAFASYGDVAARPSDFTTREFKMAGGVGIRYALSEAERINFRFDIALTPESNGAYFSAGEAF